MRLGDVAIGQRYWLNGRQYLKIDDSIMECFHNKDYKEQMTASLCLEDYQVWVVNKEYEVKLSNQLNNDAHSAYI